MRFNTSKQDAQPELQKHEAAPAGAVPRRAQQYIILGVASLIVLIALFAGHSSSARAADPQSNDPATQVSAPPARQLAQFQRRMERLQAAEQAGAAAGAGNDPPANAREQALEQNQAEGNEPQPDPRLEQQRERRYQSRFASNIALSYWPGQQNDTAQDPQPAADLASHLQQLLAANQSQPLSAMPPINALTGLPAALPSAPAKPKPAKANSAPPALDQYVLFEGTILDAVLLNRLVGDFAGPVECMVTHNVYSPNREHLLIPIGTKALGEASQVSSFGQRRLAVAFHRLILPNGASYPLDQFTGLNQSGATGLHDQVNHHYFQIFGASLAIGLLGGAAEASTNAGYNATGRDLYVQGVGSGMSQASMQVLNRFLNVMPTLTIREGHRVEIYLTGDLLLPAYHDHG